MSHFNPRSHERSDSKDESVKKTSQISIHAPTRGATVQRGGEWLQVVEFQSTLPREERLPFQALPTVCKTFQSTLPREERQCLDCSLDYLVTDFNPRSHERSDDFASNSLKSSSISIHAPTRGATTHTSISSSCGNYFNPRSHERSDLRLINPLPVLCISIHAPTRGATLALIIDSVLRIISIHAPTRGATLHISH